LFYVTFPTLPTDYGAADTAILHYTFLITLPSRSGWLLRLYTGWLRWLNTVVFGSRFAARRGSDVIAHYLILDWLVAPPYAAYCALLHSGFVDSITHNLRTTDTGSSRDHHTVLHTAPLRLTRFAVWTRSILTFCAHADYATFGYLFFYTYDAY